jgi:1-acyl-sn-glycerol-3-phosphate acyltransferase
MLTLGAKLNTTGLDNIEPNKTYIILANHTSNLDIPILMTGLPIVYYFIAKKEMKKIPFLGWIMTAVGMIFIDRSNKNTAIISMRKAGAKIKKGKNVMIFPEGTFDEVAGLLPFKKGAFHLAIHAGVDILPVAIIDAPKVWPVNESLKLKPGKVELRVGKSIKTEGLDLNAVQNLLEKTKLSIENLLENPTT